MIVRVRSVGASSYPTSARCSAAGQRPGRPRCSHPRARRWGWSGWLRIPAAVPPRRHVATSPAETAAAAGAANLTLTGKAAGPGMPPFWAQFVEALEGLVADLARPAGASTTRTSACWLATAACRSELVGLVVNRHMAALGYRSADFAVHSLRRGHATTAARNGASERTIMRTTGHTSTATVRGYVEDGELFSGPASKYLEL